MRYEVEEFRRWEYPSNWSYMDSFESLEDAKKFIGEQDQNESYRIIQEHYRND